MTRGLTERQSDALSFIERYVDERGFSPSYEEIAQGLGLASKGRIHGLISGLEERGAIGRQPDRARSIQVVEDHGAGFHLKRILDAISCSGFIGVTDSIVAEAQSFMRRAG
jgi:SOS-response transcriptional repressor LexA